MNATQTVILPFLVFFPILGGLISYLIGRKNKKARNLWGSLVTAITFIGSLMLMGKETEFLMPGMFSLGLHFYGDGLRNLLGVLAAFVWFMTTLFSDEYFKGERNRNRYYFFMLATLGATMGIFLSADFYTTFIFFEIMTFTSFVLVIHDESERTIRAAKTYLTVAILGGLVTLMGMFILYHMAGTLNYNELTAYAATLADKKSFYIVGILILFGFAAKGSMFPLHIWLPEAYPAAPAPASALLACVLTKSGIFGVFVLSSKVFLHDIWWGNFILVLGVLTMVLGAVLAVFSVSLKKTLACSSLSQIGFIVVAIGMQGLLGEHNALAAAGTILHWTNHSFLKLALFMSAGVVFMNLHKLNLNDIRGWGKNKPLLMFVFLMAALGITGVPLWNGYISKTLIHESIVEYIVMLGEAGLPIGMMKLVEWLFLFSGGLTVAYMTKLFIALFVEKNADAAVQAEYDKKTPYMNKVSAVVLLISGIILPVLGFLPHQTQEAMAAPCMAFMSAHTPEHAVQYFSLVNLKGAAISIIIGVVVYLLFIRKVLMRKDENGNVVYLDRWPEWLSLENKVYRPLLLGVLPFIGGFFARLASSLADGVVAILRIIIFNDDSGKVIPPEDKYFSAYTDLENEKTVYREGFARSLLMIGVGLAIAMLYILL